MFYKKISIPLENNQLNVEIKTKDNNEKTCVFKDTYLVIDGDVSLTRSAREIFLMTKNKNPFIKRLWITKENEIIREENIDSFGDTSYTKEIKELSFRKNLITGKILG